MENKRANYKAEFKEKLAEVITSLMEIEIFVVSLASLLVSEQKIVKI